MNKIIYTSWGYDMTHSDYAKIISETPAKVTCVMIGRKIENDNGRGGGKSYPDPTVVKSSPFKLCKRYSDIFGGVYYKGTYPLCGDGTGRMDSFTEYKGNGNAYNSWD